MELNFSDSGTLSSYVHQPRALDGKSGSKADKITMVRPPPTETEDAEIQVIERGSVEIQTATDLDEQEEGALYSEAGLDQFLQSKLPMVMEALENNITSSAFESKEDVIQITRLKQGSLEANPPPKSTDSLPIMKTFDGGDSSTKAGSDYYNEEEFDDFSDQPPSSHQARFQQQKHSRGPESQQFVGVSSGLQMEALDVAWNCNGSTLAVAYGDMSLRRQWELQSSVGIWGVFRRDLNHDQPNVSIEVTGSVTALAFHPKNPVILAGGTSMGQINIWSVFEQEPRICSSTVDQYYHREKVTKLIWLSEPIPGHIDYAYSLISISLDGKILLWKESDKLQFPLRGYNLISKKQGQSTVLGGTSLTVNCADKSCFICGTEGGSLFKCMINPFTYESANAKIAHGIFESSSLPGAKLRWSARAIQVMSSLKQNQLPKVKLAVERYCLDINSKEVKARHIFNSKPEIRALYNVPFSMNFDKHFGAVNSVSFSPFDKRLFLSCSSDGSLRVSAQFEFSGLKELEPNQADKAGLTDVQWSNSRPTVFATSSVSGRVYIFDMKQNLADPVEVLIPEGLSEGRKKQPRANKSTFNPRVRDLMAVSYSDGSVAIFRIPSSLSDYQSGDLELLSKVFESKDKVE